PEDHRQNAEDVFCVERKTVPRVEALTKRVDRACSDIAEHDAERSHAQSGEPGGCARPILPKLLFCGQRCMPGRDDLGRSRSVAGTACHAVLLSTATERSANV